MAATILIAPLVGGLMSIGGLSLGAAWQDNGDNDFTGVAGAINLAGVGLSGGFTLIKNAVAGMASTPRLAGIPLPMKIMTPMADGQIWGNYAIGLGGGAKAIIEIFNDGTDT